MATVGRLSASIAGDGKYLKIRDIFQSSYLFEMMPAHVMTQSSETGGGIGRNTRQARKKLGCFSEQEALNGSEYV